MKPPSPRAAANDSGNQMTRPIVLSGFVGGTSRALERERGFPPRLGVYQFSRTKFGGLFSAPLLPGRGHFNRGRAFMG